MTANQINFAKLQEDIRHNQATEGEMSRHNIEDERIRSETNAISRDTLSESIRHNVQSEAINAEHYGRMDTETSRSNLAREAETMRSNIVQEQERERSNRANERIATKELEETTRHNTTVEKETKRHNKAEEKIGTTQAKAATTQAKAATSQAKTAAKNADTRYYEYLTTKYHNEKQVGFWNASVLVSQLELDESRRHNQAVELETNRHNVTTEGIQSSQLGESVRHNTESEANEWNRNQNTFIALVPGSSQSTVNTAITATEKAKATESLARAGYLNTQEEWYAWNQIVNSAVDISQAVKNFSGAVPVIGMLTK